MEAALKALITGGSGLLGTGLIKKLLADGYQVRATYHKKLPVIKDDKIEYVKADLANPEDCKKVVQGIERVFLCAACTGGAALTLASSAPVTQTLIINTNMLDACRAAGVERVGLVSSTTVYPEGAQKFREDEVFNGEPYKGYFGIGWMNRYIEKLAEYFHQSFNMKIAIIRPTNIYGPNDDFDLKTAHVLPAQIAKIMSRMNPLEVWGDGSQIRDFIYVDDVAEALVSAVDKTTGCGAFNIGSGEAISVKELLPIIMEISGNNDLELKFDSSKPTAIPVRVVDTSLAKDKIGFVAKHKIRDGLEKTIRWYSENIQGSKAA